MGIISCTIQSAPVCFGSVSLQDVYNSSYMLGPIEVTPDNQDISISFIIPSSRENLNRFYDATFTLVNSAGSATSPISNVSKLLPFFSIYLLILFKVLMMYRTPLTTFKTNQLLSLLSTLEILRHWGLY